MEDISLQAIFHSVDDTLYCRFECLLLEDATGSYFPCFEAAMVGTIVTQSGIVGRITPHSALKEVVTVEMVNV